MIQLSQRGKAYLETARTLLRAAKAMTDSAIAGQLKALADNYERRAENASPVVMRPKYSPDLHLALSPNGVHDPVGQLQTCSPNSVPDERAAARRVEELHPEEHLADGRGA